MDGNEFAFITGADGVGLTDLGTLGGLASSALDVNASGVAVGYSTIENVDRHAFVTKPGGAGMVDLNSWVTLAGGAYLTEAVAINDAGQIVAKSGNGHAYLLTPVPEPASGLLMLAGLGVVAGFARRSSRTHAEVEAGSVVPARG